MKSFAAVLSHLSRSIVLGLALAFVIGMIWPQTRSQLRQHLGLKTLTPAATESADSPAAPPAPASYANAVAKAEPSVVNIYANKIVNQPTVQMYTNPIQQALYGGQPGPSIPRHEQSLGSGVIVSAKGYVLTNNHVIANADDIQVLLYDGRVARARLVGADAETDLAVLKIDAGSLPVADLTAPPPRPGDVALAIGNPLGLNQTVTMGIVSAVGRQLSNDSPEDFIQTDAAINLGNSGGALVNTRGQLVGINTLLIGRAANAEGIGFAIPVSAARSVLSQIIDTGHVVRGWLGADYGFVPVAADSGLPAAPRGAQVMNVYPGSPAALAGIQAHDILLRLGSDNITNPADLRRHEADLKPGTRVEVSGLRNGMPFHTQVVLAQRPNLTESDDGDHLGQA